MRAAEERPSIEADVATTAPRTAPRAAEVASAAVAAVAAPALPARQAPRMPPGQARAFATLQRSVGNAAVQRLVAGNLRHSSRSATQAPPAPLTSGTPAMDAGQVTSPVMQPDVVTAGAEPAEEQPAEPIDESVLIETAGGSTSPPPATGQDPGGPTLASIAREQRTLITRDSLRSEREVARAASGHRKKVTGVFGGIRAGLFALLAHSTASIHGFIAGRQAEVRAVSATVLQSSQALVAGTVQAAQGLGRQVGAALHGIVAAVTASLQGRVQGIARQITGAINGVPLPNLPGVSQLRAAAGRLVGRAAGAVTAGLGAVRNLIGSALQFGMRALSSLLARAGQLAMAALSRAVGFVQRGLQAVLQGLARIASSIVNALRTVVAVAVVPKLRNLEGRLLHALGRAQQQAIAVIRRNRDEHLRVLAAAMNPGSRDGAGQGGDVPASDGASVLRGIGREAVQNNRMVVQTFSLRIGAVAGSIFGLLAGGAARIAQHVRGLVTRAIAAIAAKVQEVLQGIRQVTAAVGSFLQSLLGELTRALGSIVQWVRAAVEDPVGQLVEFANGALSGIARFASGLVRNILGGAFRLPVLGDIFRAFRPRPASGGPIVKPPPGPITLPGLGKLFAFFALVGLLVLYAAPQLMAVFTALLALGLTPFGALVIIGLGAVVLLVLSIVGIYLLYKLLTKRPGMPKPKITHLTDFDAPDGSPKSRDDVGVGERVVFTGSAAGAWTASTGSPRTGSGKTFTWTAPNRKAKAKITLRAPGVTSVRLRVVEPKNITAVKLSENVYPAGTQGAGMRLKFRYEPLNVSFGNAQAREVSGPASDIKGYYLHHGMPHFHNAGPVRFFSIGPDNLLKAVDQASQSGYPPPWSAGSFHWKIPNKFRVATETGDGKEFTTVKQEFTMFDATGKTRITKAGEKVERTP